MLIALDPGKTIGYAVEVTPGLFRSGQCPADEIWNLLDIANKDRPIETIILESFGESKQRKIIDLRPAEVIGVIKEWARQHGTPVVPQTPSEGKHFFTDVRLKENGVFREPKTTWRHANDAMRHLQYYLKFKKGEE